MKAMILAAGFGTRLWPLTASVPKPLVPVANVPLIDRIISHLAFCGVSSVVINAHHRHQQLTEHFVQPGVFGIPVEVRVEEEILGTGGGIKNTEDFWDDEAFVVVNGDILTDIDIAPAVEWHRRHGALATLVLHDYGRFNKIVIDGESKVRRIPSNYDPGRKGVFAFTGIQVIEPALLKFIAAGCYSKIMDCYRRLIAQGLKIGAYLVSEHRWRDVGTVPEYLRANLETNEAARRLIGKDCTIAPGARIEGRAILGNGVVLEKGALVADSVIWDGVTVCEGVSVTGSVVTSGRVAVDLRNKAV
ncbi:MAG: NDP-sugar synthase [Desulfatiglandaceae bacterium]